MIDIIKLFNSKNLTNKVENFSNKEIQKYEIPENLVDNIFPTLAVLNKIRKTIDKPIRINSVYRSKEHNKDVRGRSDSLHLQANAIDFKVIDYDYNQYAKLWLDIRNGKFITTIFMPNSEQLLITKEMIGTGLYDTFIHLDTRGYLGRKSPVWWYGN